MFEKLFTFPSAVRAHRAAPLAQEREKFLLYLHQRGVCDASLRGFAALLKQIVRFLKLKELRDVGQSEIEPAAQSWFRCRRTTARRRAGPCSEPHFKWIAKRWLSFHGRYIPSPPPTRPFAHELRGYEAFMKSERGLSQPTITALMCQTAGFLRWYSARRKKLQKVALADVDKYLTVRARVWSKWSVASCAARLRAFFRYAETRSWCQSDIANGIKSSPVRNDCFTPSGPKWNDVLRLLDSTNGPNMAEVRAKAILLLVSVYALRRSEVVRLLLGDFDWTNQVFTVRRAKRGQVQQFPLGADLSDALLQYLSTLGPNAPVSIFSSLFVLPTYQ
jgi:site-specific recombinase XerD